ncbi:MAG: hypothetical protein AAGG51_19720 [Cyanobacteria bacterium P01_G01_bin.54]
MNIHSAPRTYSLVGTLQLISALFLIPLSLFLFAEKGLAVLLGDGGSDRPHAPLQLLHTQGGMALALLTLLAGVYALYVSGQLLQQRTERWLKITLFLQGAIGVAESLKFTLNVRANWLSLLVSGFTVVYLLKPSIQQGLKLLQGGLGESKKRFGSSLRLRKKSSRL